MKTGTIKIGKKSYPFAFNMKARRLFMNHFKIVSFKDYIAKVSTLEGVEKDLTLDHIDIVGYLLITAIEAETGEGVDLDPDVIWDHFESNQGSLGQFMSIFSAAQEQGGDKKANTPSSGGKSKKGK